MMLMMISYDTIWYAAILRAFKKRLSQFDRTHEFTVKEINETN